MGLRQKVFERKQEFYDIFNQMPKDNLNFMTCYGKISFEGCIENHIKAWTVSRIHGTSASLAFYGEDVNAIKLIDKIANEYFSK